MNIGKYREGEQLWTGSEGYDVYHGVSRAIEIISNPQCVLSSIEVVYLKGIFTVIPNRSVPHKMVRISSPRYYSPDGGETRSDIACQRLEDLYTPVGFRMNLNLLDINIAGNTGEPRGFRRDRKVD